MCKSMAEIFTSVQSSTQTLLIKISEQNWTKNEESAFQFTSFDTFDIDDNEGVEVEVLGMLRLSKYNKGVHSKKKSRMRNRKDYHL